MLQLEYILYYSTVQPRTPFSMMPHAIILENEINEVFTPLLFQYDKVACLLQKDQQMDS